jgi:hypothetical protein
MLLVLLPISLVAGPLNIGVDSVPIRFVVHPAAVVDVPIGVEELTSSACLVILPVALVAGRVHPDHRAFAVAESALPLACVDSSSSIGVHTLLEAGIIPVFTLKSLFRLITLEVLALHLACQLHDSILATLYEAPD